MNKISITLALCALTALAGGITLEESLELARQNNKTLLMTQEQVRKAEASYQDLRGNLLPQVSLSGAYSLARTYLPDSALSPGLDFTPGLDSLADYNDFYLAGSLSGVVNSLLPSSPLDEGSLALALQLNQVLFTGGKLANGIRAVDRYRSIQRLNYELQEQNIALTTSQLFYGCLLSEKLVQVQTEALQTARLHLGRVEAFNREGLVAEYDLLQARLAVAKLEPGLLQAQNARDLSLAAFRKQLGSPGSDLVPEGQFILPPSLQISLDEALLQGKENRLELRLADLATQIAQLQWRAERGNYLPNVAFTASAALYTAADAFAIEGDDFGTSYSVGLGLSVPLFNGFSNAAKRSAARHEYLYSKLQQDDLADLIGLEITQAYQKLRHAEENCRVQADNITLAERGLQLAQVRYENQVGIQLEVFDAQTTLSAIRLQYFQAINEVISATRELQKAMGIRIDGR